MPVQESKTLFADTFRCFDFDESNELSVDEMTLSLKGTLTGLAKLTGTLPPDDLDLEDLSQQVRVTYVVCIANVRVVPSCPGIPRGRQGRRCFHFVLRVPGILFDKS